MQDNISNLTLLAISGGMFACLGGLTWLGICLFKGSKNKTSVETNVSESLPSKEVKPELATSSIKNQTDIESGAIDIVVVDESSLVVDERSLNESTSMIYNTIVKNLTECKIDGLEEIAQHLSEHGDGLTRIGCFFLIAYLQIKSYFGYPMLYPSKNVSSKSLFYKLPKRFSVFYYPSGLANMDKTTVKPVVNPVVKRVVKPVVNPVVKPVENPVVNPVVKPVVNPVVKPVVNPVVKPVVNPIAATTTKATDVKLEVSPAVESTSSVSNKGQIEKQSLPAVESTSSVSNILSSPSRSPQHKEWQSSKQKQQRDKDLLGLKGLLK